MNHDLSSRNYLRLLALFGALACLPVAHAGSYKVTQNFKAPADMGRASVLSGSGQTSTMNYGLDAIVTATEGALLVSGSGNLDKIVAATVATRVPIASIAAGASRLMGGPVGIGIMIGMPLLKDWLAQNNITPAADGKGLEIREPTTDSCPGGRVYYRDESQSNTGPFACSVLVFAEQDIAAYVKQYPYMQRQGSCTESTIQGTADCMMKNMYSGDPNVPAFNQSYSYPSKVAPISTGWKTRPLPFDEVPTQVKTVPPPNIIPEILSKGGEITSSGGQPQQYDSPSLIPSSTVSGPATSPGESVTTTNPDGTTKTTATTVNNTYNGPNITQTTVTVTNNNGSVTTTTTNNTETPESDLCKLHPDILACQKLGDIPTGDALPKDTKNIDFTAVQFQTSASCPSPLQLAYSLVGRSFEIVLSFQPLCDAATAWIRPFMMLAAALVAGSIFVGGLKA